MRIWDREIPTETALAFKARVGQALSDAKPPPKRKLVELRTQATLVGLRGISADLMRTLKRAGFGDWQLGPI